MRVVRPHDRARRTAALLRVREQALESFHHVAVAHVPRLGAIAEHGAVVALGIGDEPGVVLGEEVVLGLARALAKLDELREHLVLAAAREAGGEHLQALIARPRAPRAGGIDLVQVGEHRFDRAVQAVEIEPVEPGALALGTRSVMPAQPLHEVEHIGVAPHPARKALEVPQRGFGVPLLARPAHPAVDAIGVGPVCLDRHQAEPLLGDERLRQLGAQAIELVRAVAGLADENQARAAQGVEERPRIVERQGMAANGGGGVFHFHL